MTAIPQSVRDLIGKHIHSVSELEILLFLRDNATCRFDPDSIGKALLMHRPAVEPRLVSLRASGLIDVHMNGDASFYQYGADPDRRALVDELARWYASHPVAITTLIFSKPLDNIIRGFADSFRIRRKEDE